MLLCWPLQEEMLECFPLLCGGSLVALGHGQGGQHVEPNMKGGRALLLPTWTAHHGLPWRVPSQAGPPPGTGHLCVSLSKAPLFAGLPRWLGGKESTCRYKRHGLDPWLGKIPWRRTWQPTPVFLPGKAHGQGSLAGSSSRGSQRVGHDLATKQQQSPCAGSAPTGARHSKQTPNCEPGMHPFLWAGQQNASKPHSPIAWPCPNGH